MRRKHAHDPGPKLLSKLAELALVGPHARQQFDAYIRTIVRMAHHSHAIFSRPDSLKQRRALVKGLHGVVTTLEALDAEEKEAIELGRAHRELSLDDYTAATVALLHRARDVERLGGSKKASAAVRLRASRKALIFGLLDAAADAGGKLTLSGATRTGSLMLAVRLMAPLLPSGIATKLGYDTVYAIKQEWHAARREGGKNDISGRKNR